MAFEKYSNEVLAWWVWHIDNGGCDLCPDTTTTEVEALVREEWAKRPHSLPRHLREQNHKRKQREREERTT